MRGAAQLTTELKKTEALALLTGERLATRVYRPTQTEVHACIIRSYNKRGGGWWSFLDGIHWCYLFVVCCVRVCFCLCHSLGTKYSTTVYSSLQENDYFYAQCYYTTCTYHTTSCVYSSITTRYLLRTLYEYVSPGWFRYRLLLLDFRYRLMKHRTETSEKSETVHTSDISRSTSWRFSTFYKIINVDPGSIQGSHRPIQYPS